jgi:hypothetical protein
LQTLIHEGFVVERFLLPDGPDARNEVRNVRIDVFPVPARLLGGRIPQRPFSQVKLNRLDE